MLGRPKLPKYKEKNGKFILVLTNQNCRLKGAEVIFPRSFRGFKAAPEFMKDKESQREFDTFQQVRFIPDGTNIVMEIVYTIKAAPQKEENGRYAEMCRRFLSDADDFREERIKELGISDEERFENDDLEDCVKRIKTWILKSIR